MPRLRRLTALTLLALLIADNAAKADTARAEVTTWEDRAIPAYLEPGDPAPVRSILPRHMPETLEVTARRGEWTRVVLPDPRAELWLHVGDIDLTIYPGD